MDEWREPDRRAQGARAIPAGLARHRAASRPLLRRMLSSRRTLRQAVLLHEVLGTPKGLEREASGTPSQPDGLHALANGSHRAGDGRAGNGALVSQARGVQWRRDPPPEIATPASAGRQDARPDPGRASVAPSPNELAATALEISQRLLRRLVGRLGLGA